MNPLPKTSCQMAISSADLGCRPYMVIIVGDTRVHNLSSMTNSQKSFEPMANLQRIIQLADGQLLQFPKSKFLILIGLHGDFCHLEPWKEDKRCSILMPSTPDIVYLLNKISSATFKWQEKYPDLVIIWTLPYTPDFYTYNLMQVQQSSCKSSLSVDKMNEYAKEYHQICSTLASTWRTKMNYPPFSMVANSQIGAICNYGMLSKGCTTDGFHPNPKTCQSLLSQVFSFAKKFKNGLSKGKYQSSDSTLTKDDVVSMDITLQISKPNSYIHTKSSNSSSNNQNGNSTPRSIPLEISKPNSANSHSNNKNGNSTQESIPLQISKHNSDIQTKSANSYSNNKNRNSTPKCIPVQISVPNADLQANFADSHSNNKNGNSAQESGFGIPTIVTGLSRTQILSPQLQNVKRKSFYRVAVPQISIPPASSFPVTASELDHMGSKSGDINEFTSNVSHELLESDQHDVKGVTSGRSCENNALVNNNSLEERTVCIKKETLEDSSCYLKSDDTTESAALTLVDNNILEERIVCIKKETHEGSSCYLKSDNTTESAKLNLQTVEKPKDPQLELKKKRAKISSFKVSVTQVIKCEYPVLKMLHQKNSPVLMEANEVEEKAVTKITEDKKPMSKLANNTKAFHCVSTNIGAVKNDMSNTGNDPSSRRQQTSHEFSPQMAQTLTNLCPTSCQSMEENPLKDYYESFSPGSEMAIKEIGVEEVSDENDLDFIEKNSSISSNSDWGFITQIGAESAEEKKPSDGKREKQLNVNKKLQTYCEKKSEQEGNQRLVGITHSSTSCFTSSNSSKLPVRLRLNPRLESPSRSAPADAQVHIDRSVLITDSTLRTSPISPYSSPLRWSYYRTQGLDPPGSPISPTPLPVSRKVEVVLSPKYSLDRRTQSPLFSTQKSRSPLRFSRRSPFLSPRRSRSPFLSPRRSRSSFLSPRRSRSPFLSPRRSRSPFLSPRRSRSPFLSPRRSRSPFLSSRRARSPFLSSRRSQSPFLSSRRTRSPFISPRRSQSPFLSSRRSRSPLIESRRPRSPFRSFRRSVSPDSPPYRSREFKGVNSPLRPSSATRNRRFRSRSAERQSGANSQSSLGWEQLVRTDSRSRSRGLRSKYSHERSYNSNYKSSCSKSRVRHYPHSKETQKKSRSMSRDRSQLDSRRMEHNCSRKHPKSRSRSQDRRKDLHYRSRNRTPSKYRSKRRSLSKEGSRLRFKLKDKSILGSEPQSSLAFGTNPKDSKAQRKHHLSSGGGGGSARHESDLEVSARENSCSSPDKKLDKTKRWLPFSKKESENGTTIRHFGAKENDKQEPVDISVVELLASELLRPLLGNKLYEDYCREKNRTWTQTEEEFEVYRIMPDMYPDYENIYEMFISEFSSQTSSQQSEQEKERVWMEFWASKFNQIKQSECRKRFSTFVDEFIQKAKQEYADLRLDTSNTADRQEIVETLNLLKTMSPSFGIVGPSVNSIISTAIERGSTTMEALELFTDPDNILLLEMAVKKLDTIQKLLVKLPIKRLLKQAKDAIQSPINLQAAAIAQASVGKDAAYVLNLIRTVLTLQGFEQTNKRVAALFLRVCKLILDMTMKESILTGE